MGFPVPCGSAVVIPTLRFVSLPRDEATIGRFHILIELHSSPFREFGTHSDFPFKVIDQSYWVSD
jgi:hypothetical protein